MKKIFSLVLCLVLVCSVAGAKVLKQSDGAYVRSVIHTSDVPVEVAGVTKYQDYILFDYVITYQGEDVATATKRYEVGGPQDIKQGMDQLFIKVYNNRVAIKAQKDADIADWTN